MKNFLSKIHWQLDQKYNNQFEMLSHNVASYRTRVGLTLNKKFKYLISAGFDFNHKAEFILIPKITQNYDSVLAYIKKYKDQNKNITLDYTDNHYQVDTKNYFYKRVFEENIIDQLVVNSNHMKNLASRFFQGRIYVIPDPIEIVPQQLKESQNNNILWFGHMSNFEYLINKFSKWPDVKIDTFKLITNFTPDMIPHFKNVMSGYLNKIFNRFELHAWSFKILIDESKNVNKIIIPGNRDDIRKSGVSSNRLITAFALGKMVAATKYDSYLPYINYFTDIDNNSEFINFLTSNFKEDILNKAINIVVPNYSIQLISNLWQEFIEELLFKKKI